MKTRGLFTRMALVSTAAAVATLLPGPAYADPTCIPPDYIVMPDGAEVRACVEILEDRVLWEVLLNDQSLASGSVRHSSLETFEVEAQAPGTGTAVSLRRYVDETTGEDTVELCVRTAFPTPVEVCRRRVLP